MKQRIFIIAALALINIIIMKYNESMGWDRTSNWAVAKEGRLVSDSLLSQH